MESRRESRFKMKRKIAGACTLGERMEILENRFEIIERRMTRIIKMVGKLEKKAAGKFEENNRKSTSKKKGSKLSALEQSSSSFMAQSKGKKNGPLPSNFNPLTGCSTQSKCRMSFHQNLSVVPRPNLVPRNPVIDTEVVEVNNLDQAKIAEFVGACCVIISKQRRAGISRVSDPSLIKEIKQALSIPVTAKMRVTFQECRIGNEVFHKLTKFVEESSLEIQERHNMLMEKDEQIEEQKKHPKEKEFGNDMFFDQCLSASLDSFGNLFWRHCRRQSEQERLTNEFWKRKLRFIYNSSFLVGAEVNSVRFGIKLMFVGNYVFYRGKVGQ